jgi:hypothetical protein
MDVDFLGLHKTAKAWYINTNVLNEMLKRVQHDKEKCVIPNQVLNLIQDLSISESRFWQ